MISRYKKKRGFTLVEVIISLAIISIMIIPAMNMIVNSTRNIQKAKQREQAELIGKEVIEEIKAINLSGLTAPSSTKTLSSGVTLKKETDSITGSETIEDKYKVEVTLVKRADITYAQEVRNYDDELDVSIDENNLIIKSINGKKILKQNITGKLSIVVTNENDVIKIGLKQTEDESEVPISFYNEVKSIIVDGKKPGNIRFNLLNQDTPVNINFIIQNNIDSEFNLCISRSKGTKFTSDEKITKESKGSVIITKQEFTPDEMGDIYDLNVTVKRDGEVLFEGNGYKNINFKESVKLI